MTILAVTDWKPAIASALLALALYAITLGGTYVYDDRYIILSDPRIDDVSLWGEFWTRDYFNGGADNLYRPLVSMTYAIQAKLHGRSDDRAWAFHLVNWLLHAAVSAAIAELARRITRSSAIALAAGLLFAAHPIHVEAVANIVGRAELMCGLGIFGALILFMRPLTIRRALATWGCLVLAVLSKEQGMLLPALLLAILPLRPRSTEADHAPPQRTPALLLILLIAWTLAAYIFVRENTLGLKFWWERGFLDPAINPMVQSVGRDRWLMPFVLLGRYIALLIAPIQLLPDYGGEVIGSRVRLADPYLYLGFIGAIAFAAACLFAALRRAWAVLFCVLGFAIIYGMIANLITLIGTNFAERLMYIPSAFLCILLAMIVMKLPRRAAVTLLTIVLVLYSVRTITYASSWNNPRRLFEAGIAQEPSSVRLYLLLAEEYERQGDPSAAREALARARDVAPDYYRVWQRSAYFALAEGDFDSALVFARRAYDLTPTLEGTSLLRRIEEARSAATQPATRRATNPATLP